MEQDIRWEQRFSNFVKALNKLSQAVEYIKHNFNEKDETINEVILAQCCISSNNPRN